MTIDSDIDAVADKEEGAVMCILGTKEESIKHGEYYRNYAGFR